MEDFITWQKKQKEARSKLRFQVFCGFCFFLLHIFFLYLYFTGSDLGEEFKLVKVIFIFADILFFIALKKYKNISQNIAHFGFSLLILSILFNNIFASEIITNLKVGETFENSKTKIVFESVNQKKEKNYNAIIANFSISNLNGNEDRFSPELRIYNQPVIATSEADI